MRPSYPNTKEPGSASAGSQGTRPVLFFSCGRGRGHAMTDLAIAESLPGFWKELDLRFVSYGTGAKTFRERGYPVIDLELPDTNPFWEVLVQAGRIIHKYNPAMVISHEEFTVLVASEALGCPSVFITDWFYPLGHVLNEPLLYAEGIIFINPPGIFAEPPIVKGKVRYFDFVVRSMDYGKKDKDLARRELEIDPQTIVISVIPGAWATEARAPLLDVFLPAFEALPYQKKHLVWVAGDEQPTIAAKFQGMPYASVLQTCWPTDRLLVASDLVVTKTNRGCIMEAASLGIRTLSITYGLNPIDELFARHIHSGIVLNYKGIDSATLAKYLVTEIDYALSHVTECFTLRTTDPSLVAAALLEHIRPRTDRVSAVA